MSRPIWQIEIRVMDLARSVDFFAAIFDWRIEIMGQGYAMIDTGRAPILSLLAVPGTGLPLGVCHYVQSDDCDADAARAVALGGRVAIERSEVPGNGAYTDTLDPWNGELAFWQAEVPGTPDFQGSGQNPVTWVEIGAADFEQARAYYGALVGWAFEPQAGMADYGIELSLRPGLGLVGGERGARLRGLTDYITVDDLVATCEAIKRSGGTVLGAPRDLGDGSLFTLFEDPDRNRFGLVQVAPPEAPEALD